MKDKKKLIPKIDLSKYNNVERLESSIEQIIIQGLIAFDNNPNKVAKHFNLDKDKVNEVFVKYYVQLVKISESKTKSNTVEESINFAIKLYNEHLESLSSTYDKSDVKILSDKMSNNINRITDRLLDIKEQETNAYDKVVNNLSANIIKMKTLEKLEKGEIEDNADYLQNVETVSEKLETYFNSKTTSKAVQVTHVPTGEIQTFSSLTEACTTVGANVSYISTYIIDKDKAWKNTYKFEYIIGQ